MKEIMTPREAAEYLSVHVRTIYRLAKNGEIPGRKIGGSWRFKKGALDQWLTWRGDPFLTEKDTRKGFKGASEWKAES